MLRLARVLRGVPSIPKAEVAADLGICKHSGYPIEGSRGDLSLVYGQTSAHTDPEGRMRVGYKPRGYFIKKYERPAEEVNRAKVMYHVSIYGTAYVYMAAARSFAGILGWSWTQNKADQALGNIEVDVSEVGPGTMRTLVWRGKPIFLYHRDQKAIAAARATPLSKLRHPATDEQRAPVDPEWLVVLAVCTHLGCVPILNQGDYANEGGFLCPCHQSHYDSAARIRRGPAPENLHLPPYTIPRRPIDMLYSHQFVYYVCCVMCMYVVIVLCMFSSILSLSSVLSCITHASWHHLLG